MPALDSEIARNIHQITLKSVRNGDIWRDHNLRVWAEITEIRRVAFDNNTTLGPKDTGDSVPV